MTPLSATPPSYPTLPPPPHPSGKEWSYLRGGLTCLDRDYGLFNDIHHNIGTHVVHHLFPQVIVEAGP